MRGCETSTTADESSGRLRLRPRDVYTATYNVVEGIVATSSACTVAVRLQMLVPVRNGCSWGPGQLDLRVRLDQRVDCSCRCGSTAAAATVCVNWRVQCGCGFG